ncbi:MAG: nitroreductase family protein [Methylibium sp.]|uniref:nitroreductase family protein n=1 Tax=Methylibium sp. TaxID=2067992 RepID=UPI001837ABBC|nr:nitroreductase family protein [Methylibium sp.]MBA3595941.1 nitroreductase family protein [Methylibium sp.]
MIATSVLASMLTRRSVSPKRLCGPGPSPEQLEGIVGAALRAPDHGGLLPWRLIEFARAQRPRLARLFEEEKLRRDPLASTEDLAKAREHATHAPVVLGFVVRPRRNVVVPPHEQWLAAGAALGHVLLAAHYMGFGAIILSGERCADARLREALGVESAETLAGFISIGSIARSPPPVSPMPVAGVLSVWRGADEPVQDAAARRF